MPPMPSKKGSTQLLSSFPSRFSEVRELFCIQLFFASGLHFHPYTANHLLPKAAAFSPIPSPPSLT